MKLINIILLITTAQAVFNPWKLNEHKGDEIVIRSFGTPEPVYEKIDKRLSFTNDSLIGGLLGKSVYAKTHIKREVIDETDYVEEPIEKADVPIVAERYVS